MAIGLARAAEGDDYVAVARRLTGRSLSHLFGRRVTISLIAPADTTMRRRAQLIDVAVPIIGPDARPVAAARFQVSREVVLLGRRVLLLAAAASILCSSCFC